MKQNNKSRMFVAHILNWETSHLNQSISKCFDVKDVPSGYFLRNVNGIISYADALDANSKWMQQRRNTRFLGALDRPFLLKKPCVRGLLRVVLHLLFTDFSIVSWFRIIHGPRNIVVHGYKLNFSTMLLMSCLNKRVIYINWARAPSMGGRWLSKLNRMSLRMLRKIYVLMSPEIRYFTPFVAENRVELLPYPVTVDCGASQLYDKRNSSRILLLGNSSWCLDGYKYVLDKIQPGSWEKIICMLNYGMEKDVELVNQFVVKYTDKFGCSFSPWRRTVSLEEYKNIIAEAPFYICPKSTQSGLGLIGFAICQGKAIILAGDNYLWIRESMGLDVYNMNEIDDFSYESLRKLIPSCREYESRMKKTKSFWKKYHSIDKWREVIVKSFE